MRKKRTVKFKINSNDCWEVTSHKPDKNKYIRIRRKGVNYSLHRVVWEKWIGPIPENTLICHSCDNPICINPEHLFIGTDQDNADDKVFKNRQFSKISKDDIVEIHKLYKQGLYLKGIAKRFNVNYMTIRWRLDNFDIEGNKIKVGIEA